MPTTATHFAEHATTAFRMIPPICHRHRFELVTLTHESAVFNVPAGQFTVRRHLIVATTRFHFEHGMPVRTKPLVDQRNQSLKSHGWMLQPALMLICPVVKQEVTEAFVETTIESMIKEIDRFTSILRANGIWEN